MSLMGEMLARGKVRDIYEAGEDLILVASDRVSVFDVVLPTMITGKGQVLTGVSLFWFDKTSHLIDNHLITADFRWHRRPLIRVRELRHEGRHGHRVVRVRGLQLRERIALEIGLPDGQHFR